MHAKESIELEVATGEATTCARRTDGSVWCWGANESGELGDGTTRERWLAAVVDASPTRWGLQWASDKCVR